MKTVNGLELNKGDVIIMTKSHNGTVSFENTPLTIVSINTGNACVKNESGATINIYFTNPADEIVLGDRKKQAECVTKKIKCLKEQIVNLEKEYIRLTKFASEEEYLVHKLDMLFKAKDKDAKIKALRELKATHYL